MLKPSINEVLEKIDNRYYLVGTVSKRARKLIDGEEPYVSNKTKEKPVCVATKDRLLTEEEIEIEEARHHAEQHQQISEEE